MTSKIKYLELKRCEAQEMLSFFVYAEKCTLKSVSESDSRIEIYQLNQQLTAQALLRNEIYRLPEMNNATEQVITKCKELYLYLVSKTKSNLRARKEKITLLDAVKYDFHFPCLITQEDEICGLPFLEDVRTGYYYIFDTTELLINLILDGQKLPKEFLKVFNTRQFVSEHSNDLLLRDVIVQTIGHILLTNNTKYKWNQTTIANDIMMKYFGLSQKYIAEGGKRFIKDAIKKIIPDELRKRGNPAKIRWSENELAKEPEMLSNIIHKDHSGEVSIDFIMLKVVLRTTILCVMAQKGMAVDKDSILTLPVLRQILNHLNHNERAIFQYEFERYYNEFGQPMNV